MADALLVRALDRATRDQEDAAKLFKRADGYGWRLMDCDKADSGDPSQRGTPQDFRAHTGGVSQGAAEGPAPGQANRYRARPG